jgi:uncharacterized membrane protein YhhN
VSREQNLLLKIYFFLTAVILLLDNFFPEHLAVSYFKFTVVLTLFPVALLVAKASLEQWILTFAVFLMVLGDFFLTLCTAIPELAGDVRIFGVISFLMAYVALPGVFLKGRARCPEQYWALIPVVAVLLPAAWVMVPHIEARLLPGVLIFALALGFMSWTAIDTLFRGYYSPAASLRFALAGYLMLISDIGVANRLFNPAYGEPVWWLQNLVWGTYIPAWTLIVLNIADERLLARRV